MELDHNDNFKMVHIEMNVDEVSLLKELLKLETVFQVRDHIRDGSDLNSKVFRVIMVFDYFRDFDDKLLDLVYVITESEKKVASQGLPVKNVVVVNKNIAKIYKMLCTETIKGGLPDYIKCKYEKLGPNLLNKIDVALNSEPIELQKSELKQEDSDIRVNILGIEGKA